MPPAEILPAGGRASSAVGGHRVTPAVAAPERTNTGFFVTLIFTTPRFGFTVRVVPSKFTTTTGLEVRIVAVFLPLGAQTTRTEFFVVPNA